LPSRPPTLLPEPSSLPQLDIDQHPRDVQDAAGVVSAIFNSRPGYVDGTADEHQCPRSSITSAPSSHRSSVSQVPSSYASMISSMDVALTRVGAGWIHARREVVRVSDYPARSSAVNRVRTAESSPSSLDVALSRIRTAWIAARRFMPVSSSSGAAHTASTRVPGVSPPTASSFPTMEPILAQASRQSTSSADSIKVRPGLPVSSPQLPYSLSSVMPPLTTSESTPDTCVPLPVRCSSPRSLPVLFFGLCTFLGHLGSMHSDLQHPCLLPPVIFALSIGLL
ncbi:hypothetical protein CF326_g9641, partial [Tilletia indica]